MLTFKHNQCYSFNFTAAVKELLTSQIDALPTNIFSFFTFLKVLLPHVIPHILPILLLKLLKGLEDSRN